MRATNPEASAQSRALARAMAEARTAVPELSQGDQDALVLYQMACLINYSMEPDSRELEASAAYQRGRELAERMKESTPRRPFLDRITRASFGFITAFGREPGPGDVLTFQDVQRNHSPEALWAKFGPLVDAWHRQLPGVMCPFRFEGDRLLVHLHKGACDGYVGLAAQQGGWVEKRDESPEAYWCDVERESGYWPTSGGVSLGEIPRISAVVFLGVIDGTHKCRPATESEVEQIRAKRG